ncbi:MAG: heavy-metal-associated domain-containing protein [Kofleriaceae bacterium]|nr:heavy-metal-associated domain-containing protein [Kofleriaceae bacterium]
MKLATLLLSLSVTLGLAACEQSHGTSKAKATDDTAAAAAPGATVAASTTADEAMPAEHGSCGGQCGGQCGGGGAGCSECAGGKVAAADEAPAQVPADARWTELKVGGMHCGGCARRIKNNLAGVDGIYDVEVDLAGGTVKIASAPDQDARALAGPRIAALGYQVAE